MSGIGTLAQAIEIAREFFTAMDLISVQHYMGDFAVFDGKRWFVTFRYGATESGSTLMVSAPVVYLEPDGKVITLPFPEEVRERWRDYQSQKATLEK